MTRWWQVVTAEGRIVKVEASIMELDDRGILSLRRLGILVAVFAAGEWSWCGRLHEAQLGAR